MRRIDPAKTFNLYGASHQVYHAEPGEGLPRHDHTFPHGTVVLAGSIVVRKQGREVVLDRDSQPVLLLANQWHEIEALEPGTVFENIFAAGAA